MCFHLFQFLFLTFAVKSEKILLRRTIPMPFFSFVTESFFFTFYFYFTSSASVIHTDHICINSHHLLFGHLGVWKVLHKNAQQVELLFWLLLCFNCYPRKLCSRYSWLLSKKMKTCCDSMKLFCSFELIYSLQVPYTRILLCYYGKGNIYPSLRRSRKGYFRSLWYLGCCLVHKKS